MEEVMTKRVTRNGVFETNSSSSHSITIVSGDYIVDRLGVSQDGICTIHSGEFGWEQETYQDSPTKAAYCATFARNRPECLEILRRVVGQELGCTVVFENLDDGYIDHQSDDIAEQAFESEKALRDFIFNPASVLETDNDNH